MEIVKKVLRWLLKHSFVILLIFIVMYGYIFWGNLLGRDTPAGKVIAYLSGEFVEVKEFVAAVKDKQEKLTAGGQPTEQQSSEQQTALLSDLEHDSGSSAQVDEPMQGAPVESEAAESEAAENEPLQIEPQQAEPLATNVAVAESDNNSAERPSLEQPGLVQPSLEQPGLEQQDADEKDAAALALASNQGQNDQGQNDQRQNNQDQIYKQQGNPNQENTELAFVSPEIEQSLEKVDNQGRPVDGLPTDSQSSEGQSEDDQSVDSQSRENKSSDASVKSDWIMARKSFYQRQYDLSEKNYQKVIENTEDNFDAYGELGNVYFNQGKSQQAASAYFEAADILVRTGQVERAKSLLGLLFYLDKSKAGELQLLIDSAES